MRNPVSTFFEVSSIAGLLGGIGDAGEYNGYVVGLLEMRNGRGLDFPEQEGFVTQETVSEQEYQDDSNGQPAFAPSLVFSNPGVQQSSHYPNDGHADVVERF